ncbi:MAG: hypothetical protein AAFV88_21700 [Planctomycetota bacterium]
MASIGVIALLALAGCKASPNANSMVRVTEDPTAMGGTIDGPPQRLATSQRMAGPAAADSLAASGDKKLPVTSRRSGLAFDDVGTLASAKPPVNQAPPVVIQTTAEEEVPDEIAAALAALKTPPNRSNNSSSAPVVTDDTLDSVPAENPKTKVRETLGGLVSASLTDLAESPREDSAPASPVEPSRDRMSSDSETVSPVRDRSEPEPSVRKTAIPQTTQPREIESVLENSLGDLPKLPNRPSQQGAPAPARIGTAKVDSTENAPPQQQVSHAGDISADVASEPDATSLAAFSNGELFEELLLRIAAPKPNEQPADQLRREILVRHLMVLAGDPENAVRAMDALGEHERAFLTKQLGALWTLIDPDQTSSAPNRIASTLPLLQDATAHLSAATESLSLRNLVFCTEIESYGKYKPFEGNRFVAGQPVIVYCEVENFVAGESDNGFYRTTLQGMYDLYDAKGNKVLSQLLPVEDQQVRHRIRDHFVAYQMPLPDALVAGSYRLELTLEDRVGNKFGQASVPFEIIAKR